MAVRIRLTRVGATKRPAYRVIAIDRRRSRDGRALEILGFYDPLTEPATVNLDTDRINAWIGRGAQPSETVVKLMKQASRPTEPAAAPKRASRPARPKTTRAATKAPAGVPASEAAAAPAEMGTGAPPSSDEAAPAAPASDDAASDDAASDDAASDEAAESTRAET